MTAAAAPEPRRSFRGVWIPAALWLDRRISALGKFLVAEIDSLSPTPRGCWASNAYLMEMLGISERQLQRLLAEVEAAGWIERETIDAPHLNGGHTRYLRVLQPPEASTPPGDACVTGGGDGSVTPPLTDLSPIVPSPSGGTRFGEAAAAPAGTRLPAVADGETAEYPPRARAHEDGTADAAAADLSPAPSAAALQAEVPETGRKHGACASPGLPPPPTVDRAKIEALLARAPKCEPSAAAPDLPSAPPAAAPLQVASGGKDDPDLPERGLDLDHAPLSFGSESEGETLLRGVGVDAEVAADLAARYSLSRIKDICQLAPLRNWGGALVVACFTRNYDIEEDNQRRLRSVRGEVEPSARATGEETPSETAANPHTLRQGMMARIRRYGPEVARRLIGYGATDEEFAEMLAEITLSEGASEAARLDEEQRAAAQRAFIQDAIATMFPERMRQ